MNTIQGFVLAGGRGRRLGTNKAAVELAGRTLVEHAEAALREITPEVFAVGNADIGLQQITLLPDVWEIGENSKASIFGLHAAIYHCKARLAAVLACDLPFVTGGLLSRLAAEFESVGQHSIDCVVPVQHDGQLQPLCGIYRPSNCLKKIESAIRSGDWRLQEMVSGWNTARLEYKDYADMPGAADLFRNINTVEDLDAARSLLSAG